ncbi:MAG: pyridoxamine kinase [Ruminococcaceae bacterium]|nr:pyridoxamine kinase [Oscillospiraceae bacterium]
MNYARVLTIQDISCLGQCSMTVALPILSACGHETCILPSAVLSTHTYRFTDFTVRDLTDDIPGIQRHWQKENISFDAIYTGYLGSMKQIDYVADIFKTMVRPNGMILVDPAMGDHGNLYYGFDDAYAKAMAKLCAMADVILPNVTEACFMTDHPYQETYDRAYIDELLKKLHAMGCPCVVMTGVGFEPGTTGVLISRNGETAHYVHPKLEKSYHGTGDCYSSAFVGALLQGKTMEEAARIAADFVVRCIKATVSDDSHWYGVKFETALGDLIADIRK